MSEAADLNRDPDFERMLRELTPERLEVSRDELFFQAGYAAGARNRTHHFIWPAIAAALLIGCGGLAAYSLQQHSELLAALATASDLKAPIAVALEEVAKPRTDAVVVDRALAIERQRDWRWLISSAPMPPGRLTAGGWQAARADVGNAEWGMGNGESIPFSRDAKGSAPSATDSNSPHRPATYRELLQRYQEG
jgi:hypothetical protein